MLSHDQYELLSKNKPHEGCKQTVHFRLLYGWCLERLDGMIYLSHIEYCPWCGKKLSE